MTLMISPEARDLIVAEEVSSEATYKARYQRPEWPGGGSGVTIGIGYDVGAGVKNVAQLRADWGGRIPDVMIAALESCIGVTGERAHAMLAEARQRVSVPWSAAIEVFDTVDVPRWYAICARALPNFESLSLDCKGVLVSLTYNRGASFGKDGDRYSEMRAIKAHMIAKTFARIPVELRSMKRLWPSQSMRGLVFRREHEAQLFERGLKATTVLPAPTPSVRKGTVTSPGLNMRVNASATSAIVETLVNGAVVEIVGEPQMNGSTKWIHVNVLSGKSGWVAARFVA